MALTRFVQHGIMAQRTKAKKLVSSLKFQAYIKPDTYTFLCIFGGEGQGRKSFT